MKPLRILVAGSSGSGKSTLMQIIGEALMAKGLNFEVITDSEPPKVDSYIQEKRISCIQDSKITLEERPTYASIDGGPDRIYKVK